MDVGIGPVNNNFLDPRNFDFGLKRSPHLNFFVQEIDMPTITLPRVNIGNQMIPYPASGTHMAFGPLSLTFRIDEEMRNYAEIEYWMRHRGFPESYDQYKEINDKPEWSGEWIYSDAFVNVKNSTHRTVRAFTFVDCFPTTLTGPRLTTVDPGVTYATATVEFAYAYFTMSDPLPNS